MRNIFRKYFAKKTYVFLGRGGIEYHHKGKVFYVETNNFTGRGTDVDIFYKGIELLQNEQQLTDQEKKSIANELKAELELNNIKALILPY